MKFLFVFITLTSIPAFASTDLAEATLALQELPSKTNCEINDIHYQDGQLSFRALNERFVITDDYSGGKEIIPTVNGRYQTVFKYSFESNSLFTVYEKAFQLKLDENGNFESLTLLKNIKGYKKSKNGFYVVKCIL